MKVVTKHISLTVTRICTILVMLGCVQTYANSSRINELEKDAVNNSENLEFGTGKENNQGGSQFSSRSVYMPMSAGSSSSGSAYMGHQG